MFCCSKGPSGNYGFRRVESNYIAQSGEVLFADFPTTKQLEDAFPDYAAVQAKVAIREQISVLESSVTPRMQQEAIVNSQNIFTSGSYSGKTSVQALADIRQQIDALRSQL